MADTRSEGRIWPLPKGVSEVAKQKRYNREFKLGAARLVVEHPRAQAEKGHEAHRPSLDQASTGGMVSAHNEI